ncbi:hypothetical protein, partial [Nocardiopsis sp. LOL_012]|uniref:hypothetical protein n=1 Tax=Nocardiopsis sp. LOL_012 TaxID=3345409 RepID=UPI003A83867A
HGPNPRQLVLARGISYRITDVSERDGHTFLTAEVLRTAPVPLTAHTTPHTQQPPAPQAPPQTHTAPAPLLVPHDAPGQITPDGYRTFTTNN